METIHQPLSQPRIGSVRRASQRWISLWLAILIVTPAASAADPGALFPPTSEVSDQKAGSVLIYNIYTSNATAPNAQNTRINITNTSTTSTAFIHLFFIDGATCSSADSFTCLTPNQTASFLTADMDPGVTGYIVAVAVNQTAGFPINFNFLIGDEYVKFATGHEANLGAECIGAIGPTPGIDVDPECADPFPFPPTEAMIMFDGIRYNKVPRMLALDSILSPADGNNTLLVINHTGGSLTPGSAGPIGPIVGLLFNDAENAFSFTIGNGAVAAFTGLLRCDLDLSGDLLNCGEILNDLSKKCQCVNDGFSKFRDCFNSFIPGDILEFSGSSCQRLMPLSDTSLRTTPRISKVIPAGRSGWMKFWAAFDGFGLLGAAINFNPNAGTSGKAFNQGHNLHKLTLTVDFYIIPVFPPNC